MPSAHHYRLIQIEFEFVFREGGIARSLSRSQNSCPLLQHAASSCAEPAEVLLTEGWRSPRGVKHKLSLAAANVKESKANLHLTRLTGTSTAVIGPPSPDVFPPTRFLSFPPTFPE